jgi:hypothetical protein
MLRSVRLTFVLVTLIVPPSRASEPRLLAEPEPERWYVYADAGTQTNNGFWTNYMPVEGAQMIRVNMVDRAHPSAGETNIRVDVSLASPWWCALAVASKPDYWAEATGPAFDLHRARKLVFFARGERGDESIQVKTAILGDKPFGDSAKVPAATPWIKLTKDWVRYELDVSKLNLQRTVTPFAVVTSRDYNPTGALTFYLDEIYFELAPAK